MNWRSLFRSFPKYAIALSVIVLSTGVFGLWWYFRSSARHGTKTGSDREAETRRIASSLPDRLGGLALVGSDLYDIDSGEMLFRNWLRGIPARIFYHPGLNNLLVQNDRGVVRVGLDGKPDGIVGGESPPAFTNNGSMAMYVKDGDIWVAETDWAGFKLVNERQTTRYGQFSALYFPANVLLASDHACLVNHQRKLLRVDFATGDLQQVELPLHYNMKRRSPDCKMMLGENDGSIFAFDIDQPEALTSMKGEGKVSDFQWLNNDACAFIVGGKSVHVYDRTKSAFSHVVNLPFECRGITDPSMDGRYVLCSNSRAITLVDVQAKAAEPLEIKADHMGWVSNDTLIYAREIPDMKVRGTWLKTVGSESRRVLEQPYLAGYNKIASMTVMRELGVVVLTTQKGLFRISLDGSEPREIAKLQNPAIRIQGVELWGQ